MKRLWKSGEPFIWLTGGALALALLLVAGLGGVVRRTLADGKVRTGQQVEREAVPGKPGQYRIKLRVANRDLYGADFQWVDEARIATREYPPDAVVVERTGGGWLIGTIQEGRDGGRTVAGGAARGLGGAGGGA